jgi:hypothetical protein
MNKKERSDKEHNMIAFDPGIRTFQIGFANMCQIVEYGKQEIGKLFSLGKKMDKLQSRIDKHTKDFY